MKKLTLILISALAFTACNPGLDGFGPDAGDADFESYVAIGNSLTAGYANGGLNLKGQQNSFPVMLAEQFALAGGGDFNVPYMQAGLGNDGSGNPPFVLGYSENCLGVTGLAPVLPSALGTGTAFNNVAANGPYNLIGVPGARAVDASLGLYSGFNPFLQRFAQTPGASTMLSEALRANPTFFTVWLGNNDALGWATGGGTGAVSPATPFPGDLSDPAQVIGSIGIVIDSLVNRGAKGVVASCPYVTSIPFFTTVPYNALTLDAPTAAFLNSTYANLGITDITWTAGANALLIRDSSATNALKIRQATADDLIVLTVPSDSIRCANWGSDPMKPLEDEYVLDATEVILVQSYIDQYNAGIKNLAATYDIGFVDMNEYMQTFKTGILYNGVGMSAEFISGGAFSLDGVHPNARGYALIANFFIETINAKYNSKIPKVNPLNYEGILFPN